MSDSSNSENIPLRPAQKCTIIPSKFKFQIGDKTTIIDQTRHNLARKTIRRKNPDPRGTIKPLWSIIQNGTIVDYTRRTITIDTHNRKNTVIRNNDRAISSEKRQIPQEPQPRLINFVACTTVGEYNRNKRKIEKFCLAEKDQAAKEARSGHPPTYEAQKPQTPLYAPGPSSTSHQQGTLTPTEDDAETPLSTNSTLDISPITTKTRPAPSPKKFTKIKSPRTSQKGTRPSIRKKATVSAAREPAKIDTLKQSYVFNLSQSSVKMNELGKLKTTRMFKEHSPGHSKPFIIAASSSAADFMVSTPTRSTVSTIAKSHPLRNIRKTKAEARMKQLNVENTIANFWPTSLIADSPQQRATKETTIIDLADKLDEPQQSPTISINPNCSSFGQDNIILSSDSQDSSPSFHTASVQSKPTRTFDSKKHTPMYCSSPTQDPVRESPEHDTSDNASIVEA